MSTGSSSPTPVAAATHAQGHQPLGPVSAGLALLTVVLWGGTAVSNQFAVDVYPPQFVGGVRFALASVFMIVWCWISKAPFWLHGKQWGICMLLGALMFVQIATFNYGTSISSASHSTILVNSYIFWVTAYESFIARTIRLRWEQVGGLLLSATAVVLLIVSLSEGSTQGMDQATLKGDLILAVSGLSLAIKVVLVKWATRSVPPGSLIMWHDIFGMLLLFAYSGLFETHSGAPLTPPALIALLFGGLVISGMCFAINAQLLQKHGASQIASFSFVTPLCGIMLAHWLRGDELSGWLLISGLCVALGIYLVNRPRPLFPAESVAK